MQTPTMALSLQLVVGFWSPAQTPIDQTDSPRYKCMARLINLLYTRVREGSPSLPGQSQFVLKCPISQKQIVFFHFLCTPSHIHSDTACGWKHSTSNENIFCREDRQVHDWHRVSSKLCFCLINFQNSYFTAHTIYSWKIGYFMVEINTSLCNQTIVEGQLGKHTIGLPSCQLYWCVRLDSLPLSLRKVFMCYFQ